MAEKNKNNNSLVFADNGYLSYVDFSKLSFANKLRRRLNIAKVQFDNGSLAKAGYALVGGYDPQNPRLSTGDVPSPGTRNPKLIIQGVLKAKSIALRAAKISDKVFDKQYWRVISSGNSKRVLAVRDLHFKAKSGVNNPYMFLHATDAKFNQFDVNRTGQNFISDLSLRNGKGIYLTLYSKDYEGTPEIIAKSPDLYGNNVMPLKAYFRNPEKTEHTYHIISSPNYDGYIYSGKDIIGEAFIRNPKLLKSAYSITYDDSGNIIPISLRDNFLINDIRYKQGGKMDILEFLKKGSGIHIKKKNRGKFTSYCGGKVTDECIRKAKASGNPTLVKRATFADNARHFKHKKGGKAFVNGVNVLDSNPKMSKAASRKVKKHLYGGDVNNPNAMGGTAFTSWLNYLLRLPELLKLKEEERKRKLELEQLESALKTNMVQNLFGTVGNFAMNKLDNLLNNKKVDNGAPATSSFWNTPSIKNALVTGNFWNTPTIANSLA